MLLWVWLIGLLLFDSLLGLAWLVWASTENAILNVAIVLSNNIDFNAIGAVYGLVYGSFSIGFGSTGYQNLYAIRIIFIDSDRIWR